MALRHVALLTALLGCNAVEDVVFRLGDDLEAGTGPTARLVTSSVRVMENAGVVGLDLVVDPAPREPLTVRASLRPGTAQAGCQRADFAAASGVLRWNAGEATAHWTLTLEDDDWAEPDEQLALVLDPAPGFAGGEVEIVIEDDDRSALFESSAFDVIARDAPGGNTPQDAALQAALDAAAESGRGVVVLEPGSYWVERLDVHPGTSLVGRSATLLRPAGLGADAVTLHIHHIGARDSATVLLEGLRIDGQRDQQGAYTDKQLELAHLIAIEGDPSEPGRVRAGLLDLALTSGTGDGVFVGPNADVQLCNIEAHDLWRDAVGLLGGGSRLDVRGLVATASSGTTGLWLSGWPGGHMGEHRVEVRLDDVTLASGDLEIQVEGGSLVAIDGLDMMRPPLRVEALDSQVTIEDSVLCAGIPSDRHNTWALLGDVRVTNSRLVASEVVDETGTAEEAERSFEIVHVRWDRDGSVPATGRLVLAGCRFEIDDTLETSDTVYALGTTGEGASIRVEGGSLGPGVRGWFAPACSGCQLE